MFSRTTAAILIAATTALGATAFTSAAHASTTTVAIDCAAGTVDYTGAPTGAALDVYVYDGTTPWWSIPVQGDGSVALPPDPGLVQSEVGLQANGTYTELAVDMVDCSAVTDPADPTDPEPDPDDPAPGKSREDHGNSGSAPGKSGSPGKSREDHGNSGSAPGKSGSPGKSREDHGNSGSAPGQVKKEVKTP